MYNINIVFSFIQKQLLCLRLTYHNSWNGICENHALFRGFSIKYKPQFKVITFMNVFVFSRTLFIFETILTYIYKFIQSYKSICTHTLFCMPIVHIFYIERIYFLNCVFIFNDLKLNIKIDLCLYAFQLYHGDQIRPLNGPWDGTFRNCLLIRQYRPQLRVRSFANCLMTRQFI